MLIYKEGFLIFSKVQSQHDSYQKTMKIHLNLSKLCTEYCRLVFFRTRCSAATDLKRGAGLIPAISAVRFFAKKTLKELLTLIYVVVKITVAPFLNTYSIA